MEEVVEVKQTQVNVPQPIDQVGLTQLLITRPEVNSQSDSKQRFSSGIGELDRVLGGGIVPGAVMLIGGEPGIGKSTLLTQMSLVLSSDEPASKAAGKNNNSAKKLPGSQDLLDPQNLQNSQPTTVKTKKTQTQVFPQEASGAGPILYVCGEESPQQINLRINRIIENEQSNSTISATGSKQKSVATSLSQQIDQNLQFVTTTDVDQLVAITHQLQPTLVIVDSIQTLTTQDLAGASGSIGQVRESADRLIAVAKTLSIPIFLVGHVTKDGAIAGPKVLEHMVDALLQLEGERTGQFRLLRALKNRFGATDEVGVFKVVEYGYEEVVNPSELFLENQQTKTPGSAVACVMEGTRPLLIEVQALVTHTQLAMPRRVGRGIELSRIQVLAAVLQKHCYLPLGEHDIFLSAAGGFKVSEPAIDLALAVAVASSLSNKPVKRKVALIGEVGLLGEVRPVANLDRRIKEAKRLGFTQVISAKSHLTLKEVLQELGLVK